MKVFTDGVERDIIGVYHGSQIKRIYHGNEFIKSFVFNPRYDVPNLVIDIDVSEWSFSNDATEEVQTQYWDAIYKYTTRPVSLASAFTSNMIYTNIRRSNGLTPMMSGLRQTGLSNRFNGHDLRHQPLTFDAGSIKRWYIQSPGQFFRFLEFALPPTTNTGNISIYVAGHAYNVTGANCQFTIWPLNGNGLVSIEINNSSFGYSNLTNYIPITSYRGTIQAGEIGKVTLDSSRSAEIGQILVYNRQLSTQEHDNVIAFLNNKWNNI